MMITDDEKLILQNKISKLIGRTFTLKYIGKEDNSPTYEVEGIIQRYGVDVDVQVNVKKEGNEPSYWQITNDSITLHTRRVGEIILGKTVITSDPCYDRDVWCMSVLKNVKSGIWKVYAAIDTIDSWGKRVYILELWHSEVKQDPNPNWVEHSNLGVDSGTMSIIDDAYYRRKNGSVDDFEASEKAHDAFAEKCFKIILFPI